uniref:Kazal-like domain-containing protein n=1 Tax=Oryza punctata TaxID=4537 RepID=A0A0E0MEE5_ORYPU
MASRAIATALMLLVMSAAASSPAMAAEEGRLLLQQAPCSIPFPDCGSMCQTPCFKFCFTRCFLFLNLGVALCQKQCTTFPIWCGGFN